MRTRKPPCPVEKVWVDKHKYDEAERLHYEREAMLAAAAPEECQEVEAVNGVCNDDSVESEFKGDLKRARNGKKQRKRKRSPKPKNVTSKLDSILTGLLADHVWFDKPLYDHAENVYRKKIVDCQSQEAPEAAVTAEQFPLVARSKAVQDVPKPRMLSAALPCFHGSLSACHHVVQDVWVNKFDFDKAEEVFVEKSQFFVPPNVLTIPSAWSNAGNVGLRTPDEGYATALPTPATPSLAPETVADSAASFVTSLPGSVHQTVNGKPQISSLQALMSEVWLEKPLYDDAEKSFYENMFDGHPSGKVRQQQRGCPEALKNHHEDRKNHSVGKQTGVKQVEIATDSLLPSNAEQPPPTRFFLHEDSETVWLNKPTYDSAESRYYAAEALKMSRTGESTGMQESAVVKPSQPAAYASSVPAPETKKMAVDYFLHEKIWFEKYKYDDAERRYYEQMNGPVSSSSHQQSASTTSSGPAGDQNELLSRISHLEVENQNLRSVVADLQMAIFKLESRLNALEKSSTSHQPSPVPPTQKVEPFSVPSKKVELPSASPAKKVEPAAAEEDDDDDIDLFGSDDEEEDQEAAKVREERLRQYAEKKAKKPGLIAKSSILLDVKPWDDETDMAKMEECVRSIHMDGLVWGASKLVPVGYGIKKLQIQCVVEDDKVGTDILEEEITKFEDYVQSVDIAAFNKI
ncbi:elongation factor 1-delta isoform X5 [Haliaeetus albicilla]|uniref:elongation factor 1-delta isoform X5 n=2 Tax=Haliaeetus TaxID=8968 RepID=UPI0005224514|nr:PREDICTED: elongation factor 1-delta isoform X3 [Haliaeetus albicilla]XP_010582538.1 PREDICTED: elongation factor 1-delta isoform X3 [Haliaeetus leucocephalus]